MNQTANEEKVRSDIQTESTERLQKPHRRSRAKDAADRKRAVYIGRACEACKRRKTRCDGTVPCGLCRRRSMTCNYTNSGRESERLPPQSPSSQYSTAKQVGIAELTELVSSLQQKVARLEQRRGDADHDHAVEDMATSHDRGSEEAEEDMPNSVQATSPVFAGPTSANFSFGIARMIFEQSGADKATTAQQDQNLIGSMTSDEDADGFDGAQFECSPLAATQASMPLPQMTLDDALRLIRAYNECLGVLHPLLEVEWLESISQLLWLSRENAAIDLGDQHSLQIIDVVHLKMVLAIGLLAEGGGASSMARAIYETLESAVASQLMARAFSLPGQILLILTAFYHSFQDDHRLASRYIANAARLMLESGLHQKPVLLQRYPVPAERTKVLVVLATCTFLDRQLNFNAGLPFTLKESDIDLPQETLPPYLKAMTAYARIGPPAWASIIDGSGRLKPQIKDEDFDYMDFQVRRWQDSLPRDLVLGSESVADEAASMASNSSLDRGTQFVRSMLYLRANQFKIVIFRPLLFSPRHARAHSKRVRQLTQLATDNVNHIIDMNENQDLYQKHQPLLNIFLSSALSALFLVYVHSLKVQGRYGQADKKLFADAENARQVIGKGLGLLQMYLHCRSSKRLWKKFTSTPGILNRLGFAHLASKAPPTNVSADEASFNSFSGARPPQGYQTSADHDMGSLSWNNFNIPPYCGSEGSEHLAGGDFQPTNAFGHFPNSSFFEFNPLLIPGDPALAFDDLWWPNIDVPGG
ncbi:hypothetical protein PV10_01591 [Exophiala mesophila]|uniref:Zn(2)-C6 fungal-type domain-containing protein n=1 Tax=Exophiala mesophila TaxID=212818 RepID=A0A0D1YB81_EXOME|nr:uncharacterized protein PV10_01591 [Exophiala mesophila]KIV97891.1 hypothetical protein PV10_01591 [Exophiala mesophila]